jgi:hypothetical protein
MNTIPEHEVTVGVDTDFLDSPDAEDDIDKEALAKQRHLRAEKVPWLPWV